MGKPIEVGHDGLWGHLVASIGTNTFIILHVHIANDTDASDHLTRT